MGLVHLFCNLSPIVTVCMQAQTHGSSQQAESASWIITPISMADGAYLLVLQLKGHCHCLHASTNPWQLTTSRECLLGNYTRLYGQMGLVHLFCNLSPIVTVCMQAQTLGSSQQAESASWIITPISMADGAYLLVLQLKGHCHCLHASTNPWQLTTSRECLLGNYKRLYGRWGLCICFAT